MTKRTTDPLARAAAKVEARRLPDLRDRHFVAIDPGKDYFGWALFNGVNLLQAEVAFKLDYAKYLAGRVNHAVVESQVLRTASRVDPQDLIDLAFSAGVVAGSFRTHDKVSPQQWKGSISADIILQRIEALALDRGEHEHIRVKGAARQHALDAVGIGYRCIGIPLGGSK